jgi:ectoine hydroxylase-related dioxygenase (phytanoyl-CoA dioxygenase family)
MQANDSPPTTTSLEQQTAFFHTFGALKVPGLFAADIELIIDGFEEMFRTVPADPVDPKFSLHRKISDEMDTPRHLIFGEFIERSSKLAWLRDDPRITDLARALLGEHVYNGSAGNLFNSYIRWHSDHFNKPVPPEMHVHFAFYLDDLDAESGAFRVMPGTHHPGSFRASIYDEQRHATPQKLEGRFGLAEKDLPCWAITVHPGDLLVFNDAILHANFNGRERRRMFSLQFAQRLANE